MLRCIGLERHVRGDPGGRAASRGRWSRTSAGTAPGRSARARAGPRTRGRPRPARSRPARRCRCTAAARRRWRCLSSGHRSRRPPARPADRRGAPQHSRVRHPACRLRPTSRAPEGAASRPAWRPRHAQISSSSSCAAARPAVPPRAPAPGAAALPCGNGPDPGHQLIEYPRPADGVYAVASGHQTIITCQHKPG